CAPYSSLSLCPTLRRLLLLPRPPPTSTLFPYTTLFRSIGKIVKPFALTLRLFANMTAGHFVILALLGLIFIFGSWLVAAATVMLDRKSTRLNSSHVATSYAVFCLKKNNSTDSRLTPWLS